MSRATNWILDRGAEFLKLNRPLELQNEAALNNGQQRGSLSIVPACEYK